jgi:hypothetical protein
VPLRHARIGRIGEAGQMPTGWRAEHLQDLEIIDVGSRGGPWITLRMAFGADIPGEFAGLGIGSYLPAPATAKLALAVDVTLGEWANVGEVLLILRESRMGGGLVGQAARSLQMIEDPQRMSLSHGMIAEGGVAEPVLMMKRETADAGWLILTLRGLAFGNIANHPDWRFASRVAG